MQSLKQRLDISFWETTQLIAIIMGEAELRKFIEKCIQQNTSNILPKYQSTGRKTSTTLLHANSTPYSVEAHSSTGQSQDEAGRWPCLQVPLQTEILEHHPPGILSGVWGPGQHLHAMNHFAMLRTTQDSPTLSKSDTNRNHKDQA